MKYIRTKDGRIKEKVVLNIGNIESVENLWCDFHFDDGILHFVKYFPKEKETLEILQRELKNVVFIKEKINSDYYDYDYEPIKKDEILNQSDTIEELCDEFIIIDLNDKPVMKNEHERVKELLKVDIWHKKYKKIYGAIWTDKGLIYVAKMNDKGELELL